MCEAISDNNNMDCDYFKLTLEEEIDTKDSHTAIHQKSISDEEMNLNDNHYNEDEPYSAPMEVLSEFLSTLMARNYKSALYYCKLILLYEPNNEIVKCFYPVIKEKMQLDNYDSDENDTSNDESSSSKSGSSTEYFSSTSVGTENMSSSSSLYSEDEDSSFE
ncbi:hypothetical protein JTE90_003083 [Oedothorax gibbosus]|uniref:Glutamate-rich protein 2 n=1 Tax=Oedothorax gibbosus TaxID=931172 RepID=A0AAV6TUX6_9ARAC|nr:hypothetical protein JTE90_003083 [Oedothorax gibbosus]